MLISVVTLVDIISCF